MRKWILSLFLALFGGIAGWFWLKEREVTKPVLRVPPVPPTPETPPKPDVPPVESAPSEAPTPDPLTEINGIGPAYEKALHELGIYTFAQLAEQSAEALAERLDNPRLTAERIERDEWIEQAKARANEKGQD